MPARLGHLTLDTTDLDRAVAFWSAVFDGSVWQAEDGSIAIVSAAGMPDLMVQRVDATGSHKNQLHLDLFATELDAEITRLEGLGARPLGRYQQWGTTWATMLDPDGYVFDVVEHD
jgi:predicted enzyme related to lactoylglutathione lyase